MNTQKKQSGIRTIILVLVVVAVMAGAIGVTRAAAQSAIPGDALYPVKTGLEQTRLSLARDAGVRAEMKIEFAEQRLSEIQKLIEEGRYQEVSDAVLAFEAEINSAILELGTLAENDPTRAVAIAKVITSALTRYAQALSLLAASAPDNVRSEVARALDTTQVAGGLPLIPATSNSNDNDNSSNDNGNANSNSNDNGFDDGVDDNANGNDNSNSNGDDSNSNGNDDSANSNSNANANDDGVDDNANSNGNANSTDDNSNTNDNGNGNGDDNSSNDNGNGNGDDNSNSGNDDDGVDNNANGNDNSNNDDKP